MRLGLFRNQIDLIKQLVIHQAQFILTLRKKCLLNGRKYILISMGSKYKEHERENSPGVGKYDNNYYKHKSPQYSFSKNNHKEELDKKPGPGDYSPNKSLYTYPKWSIRMKYDKDKLNDNPSPQDYSPNKFFPSVKHSFSPNKNRFELNRNSTSPGPIYFPNNNKYKNNPLYTMRQRFKENNNNNNPGPFDYDPKKNDKWKNTM